MKMHGLGNDFVVVDARGRDVCLGARSVRLLADRRRGVGLDQLVVLRHSDKADLRLEFYNTDGSIAGACGNASRCVARHVMTETGNDRVTLETVDRILEARDAGGGLTSVNMGHARIAWHDIPLAREVDTLKLPLRGEPTATSMGNPHCTFFVEDADAIDLEARGPEIENDPLFPERTNVQFASVLGPNLLRLRVWERGAGVTLASGSSSCAVAAAALRRGLAGPRVTLQLDGGTLGVRIERDGIWMTGETAHVFDGRLTAAMAEQL